MTTGQEIFRFLNEMIVGPFGLVTMGLTYALAIVLPIVTFYFFVFGLLEDSGYLPRLAVLLNRSFRAMGLNGKAVLPMVLGLGCDTMATLTTRVLDTAKERLIVILLLALAVPCSAQLGVVLAMLSGVSWGAAVIWVAVTVGVLFLVGYLASKVLPGKGSDFLLEIPPMRWPKPRNILVKTLARVEWYLREAVPLFLAGTLILFLAEKTDLLRRSERLLAPVVTGLLGLPAETAKAFLAGFLRRDYGAVFLLDAARSGRLDGVQVLVSVTVITLFLPCIANFFVIAKERGLKTALAISAFVFPFAIAVGAILRLALRASGIRL